MAPAMQHRPSMAAARSMAGTGSRRPVRSAWRWSVSAMVWRTLRRSAASRARAAGSRWAYSHSSIDSSHQRRCSSSRSPNWLPMASSCCSRVRSLPSRAWIWARSWSQWRSKAARTRFCLLPKLEYRAPTVKPASSAMSSTDAPAYPLWASTRPTVQVRDLEVRAVTGEAGQFTVSLGDGTTEQASRLLLATGVADQLPPIPGLAQLWGRGVFNCPYCDGWEVRDQPLAVLGADPRAMQLAVHLTRWSGDVVWCPGGPPGWLDDQGRTLLAARGVRLREEPVARLEVGDGHLDRVVFASGAPLPRRAAFLHPPTRQRSDLPVQLGCRLLEDGSVEVSDLGQTSGPGVFAAGDMARRPSMP